MRMEDVQAGKATPGSSIASERWKNPTEAYATFDFEGAGLGISADWETGSVITVIPGLQCDKRGVKAGWRIAKVDDRPYTEALLDEAIAGSAPYSITFETLGQAIEGTWSGGTITGTTLSWSNGTKSPISIITPTEFTVTIEDTVFTAALKEDGKLHWRDDQGDDDVWERKVLQGCASSGLNVGSIAKLPADMAHQCNKNQRLFKDPSDITFLPASDVSTLDGASSGLSFEASGLSVPREPGDSPLEWLGSPSTARSQGSWDPDCQTWRSKGFAREQVRTSLEEKLAAVRALTPAFPRHCLRPRVPIGHPLVEPPKQCQENELPLPAVSSSIRLVEPPSQQQRHESKEQRIRDAWTLSEEEALELESEEASSFHASPQREPEASSLPASLKRESEAASIYASPQRDTFQRTIVNAKVPVVEVEDRRREREQALKDANAAALKVQAALKHASLHRCVEELGRRVEHEGEMRRKAEEARAEAEQRLAEINTRLDIERRERTALLDQLKAHVQDSPIQDATTRSWTLLEATLACIAEEAAASHGQKADAADEAGGRAKSAETLRGVTARALDLGNVKKRIVQRPARITHPFANVHKTVSGQVRQKVPSPGRSWISVDSTVSSRPASITSPCGSLKLPARCEVRRRSSSPLRISPEIHYPAELLEPLFRTRNRSSTPPLTELRSCTSPHLTQNVCQSPPASPHTSFVVERKRSTSPTCSLSAPFLAQGRSVDNTISHSRTFGRRVLRAMGSVSPPRQSQTVQLAFPCSPGRNAGWPAARPSVT